MTGRGSNISNEQKETLVLFMEENEKLRRGKFDGNFTFKKAQELWISVTNNLNSMVGATKSWKQWRKTWQDLRSKAKSKKSLLLKHRNGTGGGEMSEDRLTDIEEKVVELIGVVCVEGQPNTVESEVQEISEDTNENEEMNNQNKRKMVHHIEDEGQNDYKNKKKNIGVRRLEKTIVATEILAKQNERKILVKENYYKKKLELMEAKIMAQNRIALALEKIAENINTLK